MEGRTRKRGHSRSFRVCEFSSDHVVDGEGDLKSGVGLQLGEVDGVFELTRGHLFWSRDLCQSYHHIRTRANRGKDQ